MNRFFTLSGIAALGLLGLLVSGFIVGRITGTIGLYNIPSSSMEPTLRIGTHLITSSIPYWRTKPKRGDIVTFIVPTSDNVTYIMRIIGLPGDTVQMRDNIVILNGTSLKRKKVESYQKTIDLLFGPLNSSKVAQYEEQTPSGRKYKVIQTRLKTSPLRNTRLFKVPAGHYFMLGDNRDNSNDSRISETVGFVPYGNLRGKMITRNPVSQSFSNIFKILFF